MKKIYKINIIYAMGIIVIVLASIYHVNLMDKRLAIKDEQIESLKRNERVWSAYGTQTLNDELYVTYFNKLWLEHGSISYTCLGWYYGETKYRLIYHSWTVDGKEVVLIAYFDEEGYNYKGFEFRDHRLGQNATIIRTLTLDTVN